MVKNFRISKIEMRDEGDPELRIFKEQKSVVEVLVGVEPKQTLLEGKLHDATKFIIEFLKKFLIGKAEVALLEKCEQFRNWHSNNNLYISFKKHTRYYDSNIGKENVSECYRAFRLLNKIVSCRSSLAEQSYESFSGHVKTLTAQLDPKSKLSQDFKDGPLSQIIESLESESQSNSSDHPKMATLKSILIEFFESEITRERRSKAIVFTNDRANACFIQASLNAASDEISSRIFVGQSSSGKIQGMNQKEQIAVLNEFKNGVYNVLIATSVAEEGLDIGEVDLIICYDSGLSPIRWIQRMGRTGRKRSGKVILLLTNREMAVLKHSQRKYRSLVAELRQAKSNKNFQFFESPRMIPPNVDELKVRFVYKSEGVEQKKEDNTISELIHRILRMNRPLRETKSKPSGEHEASTKAPIIPIKSINFTNM